MLDISEDVGCWSLLVLDIRRAKLKPEDPYQVSNAVCRVGMPWCWVSCSTGFGTCLVQKTGPDFA